MDELGKADQDEENSSDKEAVQEETSVDHGLVGDTAAGPGEKNQHKAGDHSFEEHSSWGCLEMGGGFCIDEAQPELETDQISLGQNRDPSFEADLSKDYLNMGGGFCLDEDETMEDPDICCNLAVEADPDMFSSMDF